jgi:hypothetical protein
MTSLQIKLGRLCENSNAASLALSIKGAEGFCERVGGAPAGADAAAGGSGQGGGSGCLPRFKMGGASEQAGAFWDCDSVAGGGAEGDCAACDCDGDALCAFRETGVFRTRASRTPLRQLDPQLKLRMIHFQKCTIPILPFRSRDSIHPTTSEAPCGSALPTILQSASRRADFSGLPGSLLLRPVKLLAPCADLTTVLPATGTFISRLPTSRVTLLAAGYNYHSHWTVLSKGLSPFGMTASVAAP